MQEFWICMQGHHSQSRRPFDWPLGAAQLRGEIRIRCGHPRCAHLQQQGPQKDGRGWKAAWKVTFPQDYPWKKAWDKKIENHCRNHSHTRDHQPAGSSSHPTSAASAPTSSAAAARRHRVIDGRCPLVEHDLTGAQRNFIEVHLALHPPKSIEHAVCTDRVVRVAVVTGWLGSVFNRMVIPTWDAAPPEQRGATPAPAAVAFALSARALPSSSATSELAALPKKVLEFYYDSTVHNCVRRMWDGFGDLTGFIDVMASWLRPLLERASIYFGNQANPLARGTTRLFVGMSVLPPCLLTPHTVDEPSPIVVAHLRTRRKHNLVSSQRTWTVVDLGCGRLASLVSR